MVISRLIFMRIIFAHNQLRYSKPTPVAYPQTGYQPVEAQFKPMQSEYAGMLNLFSSNKSSIHNL